MKIQAKFTVSFIFISLITLVISFFVIHSQIESTFEKFIQEKNQQWENSASGQRMSDNDYLRLNRKLMLQHQENCPLMPNPFKPNPLPPEKNTPEERFLVATTYSLIISGLISIVLSIIIGYLLSKFLLLRIYRLSSAMKKYEDEGVSEQVPHDNIDEIDNLAEVYNLLIKKIDKQENIRKDFFIDMSHELRTPLTSVKGYLEGLIDKVFDCNKENEIHKKALSETNRMINLVKEMTVLAKLESGEMALEKQKVSIKKLTLNAVQTLRQEIDTKEMAVDVDGDATAEIDKNKFTQIILNLIDNAISHGKEKTKIYINIEKLKDTEKFIWAIKNTPKKEVDEKDLKYIFERFYRADKSRTFDEKKPHLGIGLNIAKKLVEFHKGTINVKLNQDGLVIFEVEIG